MHGDSSWGSGVHGDSSGGPGVHEDSSGGPGCMGTALRSQRVRLAAGDARTFPRAPELAPERAASSCSVPPPRLWSPPASEEQDSTRQARGSRDASHALCHAVAGTAPCPRPGSAHPRPRASRADTLQGRTCMGTLQGEPRARPEWLGHSMSVTSISAKRCRVLRKLPRAMRSSFSYIFPLSVFFPRQGDAG